MIPTLKSPYKLLVSRDNKDLWKDIPENEKGKKGLDKLNIKRSLIPAVTHVDYSARVQTVSKTINPRFYRLIKKFKEITNCPTLINTSFNVRGEPIVCTPKDAFICFMRTEMDILVLQNQILYKEEQTDIKMNENWFNEFELD